MLRINLTDSRQEAAVIDAIQRERTDEYREVVGSTQQFHEELRFERRRGRAMYTELEESDADLARHQKWLAKIRARDYFDAPGGEEAVAAVASCEEALARFESGSAGRRARRTRVGRPARPARRRRHRRLTPGGYGKGKPACSRAFPYAPKRTRTSTRLSRTRPSTWRVYQFRHRRKGDGEYSPG